MMKDSNCKPPRNAHAYDPGPAFDECIAHASHLGPVVAHAPRILHEGPCNATPDSSAEQERQHKTELLRTLIDKGAGLSALQYSLKMNKTDIKRMAQDNGLRITSSRALHSSRKLRVADSPSTSQLDEDVRAGHAMHYCALGYNAVEIAQKLELTVREVWELARTYRFDLKQPECRPSPARDLSPIKKPRL